MEQEKSQILLKGRKNKMLEGISVALKSHYDTANGAKNILESAVAQIKANYIGAMLAEKMKEAQEIYNNTLAESRKANFDACIEILDDVANQARKVVEVSVPADFISTLEAIKNSENRTQREIEAVLGAYKNNYWAYRSVSTILGGSLKGFGVITIDEILDHIDDLKAELHKCFYQYNVTEGYQYRNVLEGTIISDYDDVFRAFIEGRFEDAVQNEEGKE